MGFCWCLSVSDARAIVLVVHRGFSTVAWRCRINRALPYVLSRFFVFCWDTFDIVALA